MHAAWYAFVVLGVVIAIDASRTVVSWRTVAPLRERRARVERAALRRATSPARSRCSSGCSSPAHGHPNGDPIAALFVGVLVLLAAARLIKANVDVLMDRAPADAEAAARAAIGALAPAVELRRLRMRQAGGRQFADVVIGVLAGAGVGQGHAAADAVEEAVEQRAAERRRRRARRAARGRGPARARARCGARACRGVREVHNLALVDVDGRTELSLHVKLPGELSLDEAHDVAEQLEAAICAAVPEIDGVQTHLEPLTETTRGARGGRRHGGRSSASCARRPAREPRELRFLRTDAGLVAFLTLGLDGTSRSTRRTRARARSRSASGASGRTSPT